MEDFKFCLSEANHNLANLGQHLPVETATNETLINQGETENIQSKTREEELICEPPEELTEHSNESDILREFSTVTKDAAKRNEEDLVWEHSK